MLAYARVWGAGWVYDDPNWFPFKEDAAAHVVRAPFALAGWIGGGLPWAYHGLIVAVHLLNGALLYALARRWMSRLGALVALTVFWLHPIQVESVAYVTGGIEVLLTTYVLIAALGLLSSSWWGWSVGAISLLGAVALKFSALPLLVVLPVAVAIVRGRWRWLALVGVVAAGGVAGGIWWRSDVLWVPQVLAKLPTWDTRLDVTPYALALWRYLGLLVWPVGFSIEHDWLAVPGWVGRVAIVATVAVGALAVWARRVWTAPAWAWCWVMGLVLPRALVPNAPPLTEHHTYLPFLAVWLLAGSAVDRVSQRTAYA